MEASLSFETPVNLYRSTRRLISEDNIFQSLCLRHCTRQRFAPKHSVSTLQDEYSNGSSQAANIDSMTRQWSVKHYKMCVCVSSSGFKLQLGQGKCFPLKLQIVLSTNVFFSNTIYDTHTHTHTHIYIHIHMYIYINYYYRNMIMISYW